MQALKESRTIILLIIAILLLPASVSTWVPGCPTVAAPDNSVSTPATTRTPRPQNKQELGAGGKQAAPLIKPALNGKESASSVQGTATSAEGQPRRPANRPVKDKWALVIGISKFAAPGLNLRYSDQDARDFADFLVKEAHFAPDHIKLLLNEQATQRAILSELGNKWLPRVAAPDDLVVVFISSHGSSSSLDLEGVNYILAHDSDPEDLYVSGIDMPKLAAIIKARVHSDRIVIILDACHSGAARASTKGLAREANIDAAKIAQGTGQLVIASSLPDQVSWEFRDRPNSVFTRSLIEGFKSKGQNTTLAEAFAFLKKNVQDTVLHERGKLQVPVLKSSWSGNELVIGAIPSEPRPAPPLAEPSSPSRPTGAAPQSEQRQPGQPSSGTLSDTTAAASGTSRGEGQPSKTQESAADITADIEPDPLVKRLGLDRPEEPATQPARSTLKVPLPDRVAILGFSGTRDMETNLTDVLNNPVILLEHMVYTKLQSALGRRLVNVFDSTSALARAELSGGTIHDRENIMNLGRAFKARYIISVRIEQASFNKNGDCNFATILKIFDGETGDPIFVEGNRADCPRFEGKAAERPFYIKSVVLPAAAEQIFQSIVTAVNAASGKNGN